MPLRRAAVALALLLVAALAAPASAATSTRETIQIPMTGESIVVVCTDGAPLTLTGRSGTIKATTTSLVNGSAGTLRFEMVYQGVSAVDTNGTIYRLAAGIRESEAYRAEPKTSFHATFSVHQSVTAQGLGLLFRAHTIVHVVIGPDGRTVTDFVKTWYTCPGDPV